MEISIERSPQHWCPSAVSNSQPLDPEFDALDHSATDPEFSRFLRGHQLEGGLKEGSAYKILKNFRGYLRGRVINGEFTVCYSCVGKSFKRGNILKHSLLKLFI